MTLRFRPATPAGLGAMPLEHYKRKRRFEETPEPPGAAMPAAGGWRFVVQEHHARRLHWDLRLEIDGTLISWAVPKGPTLDSREKRLAVHTEDHPLEYADFEGEIPAGNYGAGTMIIWDRGIWVPESDEPAADQLAQGELKFSLKGTKLRGGFALVRLKSQESKQEEWLLLKHQDSYTDENWRVEEHPGSALQEDQPSPGAVEGAVAAPMPEKVELMMATLASEAFSNPEWLFEIKWDGMRAAAFVRNSRVRLQSRAGRDVTSAFPELAVLAERLMAREAVIDGEVVVLDAQGRSDFERLQPRMHSLRPSAAARREAPVDFYAFDLLYCDGHDLRQAPLAERKRLLREVLDPLPPIRFSDHVEARGSEFFRLAAKGGAEGIVAKKMSSVYESERSTSWIKIKAVKELDAVVGGYTSSRGAGREFGALLVGLYDGSRLDFVGGVGSGFAQKTQEELYERLTSLRSAHCPFGGKPETAEPAHWVRPELVARVKYREMTSERRLRQPVYLGLRDDVSPSECTHAGEAPQAAAPMKVRTATSVPVLRKPDEIRRELEGGTRDEVILELEDKPVRVRNLNKVYFPDAGVTKRELLRWYHSVAGHLLPFLANRPLVLHRYPNGITGQPFYQKDAGQEKPDWIRTVTIASDGGKQIEYYVADDLAALLFLANLGCIEHNPWSSSLPSLDRPDYVFFDLDPVDGVPYSTVAAVGREVWNLLDEIGCKAFAKTSGASGMHIFVPLEPVYEYEQARTFAEIVARIVHTRMPEQTTLQRMTDKRPEGTVYLDYSQNGYGRPLASIYSVRPRPVATVSAPLEARELRATLKPDRFTIRTMAARLGEKGDLWSEFWEQRQRIEDPLQGLAVVLGSEGS